MGNSTFCMILVKYTIEQWEIYRYYHWNSWYIMLLITEENRQYMIYKYTVESWRELDCYKVSFLFSN